MVCVFIILPNVQELSHIRNKSDANSNIFFILETRVTLIAIFFFCFNLCYMYLFLQFSCFCGYIYVSCHWVGAFLVHVILTDLLKFIINTYKPIVFCLPSESAYCYWNTIIRDKISEQKRPYMEKKHTQQHNIQFLEFIILKMITKFRQ